MTLPENFEYITTDGSKFNVVSIFQASIFYFFEILLIYFLQKIIQPQIGKGAYATVYKAVTDSGETIVAKTFDSSRISKEILNAIKTEVQVLKKLDHPHIVKYLGATNKNGYFCIFLEYCENGSLDKIVRKANNQNGPGSKGLSESEASRYTYQVLLGLQYLHTQGVIHRDIKCANLLVSKDGTIKLADFGVASITAGSNTNKSLQVSSTTNLDSNNLGNLNEAYSYKFDGSKTFVGTPHWMAPEVILLQGATAATDIWSLGCTVIELLTGYPPYYDFSQMARAYAVVEHDNPPIPKGISELAEDFLLSCLKKDQSLRADATRLLKHPWITKELGIKVEGHESSFQNDLNIIDLSIERNNDSYFGSDITEKTAVIDSNKELKLPKELKKEPFGNKLPLEEWQDEDDFSDLEGEIDISILEKKKEKGSIVQKSQPALSSSTNKMQEAPESSKDSSGASERSVDTKSTPYPFGKNTSSRQNSHIPLNIYKENENEDDYSNEFILDTQTSKLIKEINKPITTTTSDFMELDTSDLDLSQISEKVDQYKSRFNTVASVDVKTTADSSDIDAETFSFRTNSTNSESNIFTDPLKSRKNFSNDHSSIIATNRSVSDSLDVEANEPYKISRDLFAPVHDNSANLNAFIKDTTEKTISTSLKDLSLPEVNSKISKILDQLGVELSSTSDYESVLKNIKTLHFLFQIYPASRSFFLRGNDTHYPLLYLINIIKATIIRGSDLDLELEKYILIVLNSLLSLGGPVVDKFCLLGGLSITVSLTSQFNPKTIRLNSCKIINTLLFSDSETSNDKMVQLLMASTSIFETFVQFISEYMEDFESYEDLSLNIEEDASADAEDIVKLGVKGILALFQSNSSILNEMGLILMRLEFFESLLPALNHFVKKRTILLKRKEFELAKNLDSDVNTILSVFPYFAKMDRYVKSKILNKSVTRNLFQIFKRLRSDQQLILLKFFRSMSVIQENIVIFEETNIFNPLMIKLKECFSSTTSISSTTLKDPHRRTKLIIMMEQIFSIFENMCRLSSRRQEIVVKLGLVPYLTKIASSTPTSTVSTVEEENLKLLFSNSNLLREIATSILLSLANVRKNNLREVLLREGALDIFLDLTTSSSTSWQASAFDAIESWFTQDSESIELFYEANIPNYKKNSLLHSVATRLITGLSITRSDTVYDQFVNLLTKNTKFCIEMSRIDIFYKVLKKGLETESPINGLKLLKIAQLVITSSISVSDKSQFSIVEGKFESFGVKEVIEHLATKNDAVLIKDLASQVLNLLVRKSQYNDGDAKTTSSFGGETLNYIPTVSSVGSTSSSLSRSSSLSGTSSDSTRYNIRRHQRNRSIATDSMRTELPNDHSFSMRRVGSGNSDTLKHNSITENSVDSSLPLNNSSSTHATPFSTGIAQLSKSSIKENSNTDLKNKEREKPDILGNVHLNKRQQLSRPSLSRSNSARHHRTKSAGVGDSNGMKRSETSGNLDGGLVAKRNNNINGENSRYNNLGELRSPSKSSGGSNVSRSKTRADFFSSGPMEEVEEGNSKRRRESGILSPFSSSLNSSTQNSPSHNHQNHRPINRVNLNNTQKQLSDAFAFVSLNDSSNENNDAYKRHQHLLSSSSSSSSSSLLLSPSKKPRESLPTSSAGKPSTAGFSTPSSNNQSPVKLQIGTPPNLDRIPSTPTKRSSPLKSRLQKPL